jgi:sugar phosphate permease
VPDVPAASADPVLARRARIATAVKLGQRLGYSLFGVAIVLFFVALATTLTDALMVAIIVCLALGSLVLAPAIVFGYAVKAADRDDRDHGRL